jgi:hypothetical protein
MPGSAIIPDPDRFVKANKSGIICCIDRILIFCLDGGLKNELFFPNADIECPYSFNIDLDASSSVPIAHSVG